MKSLDEEQIEHILCDIDLRVGGCHSTAVYDSEQVVDIVEDVLKAFNRNYCKEVSK